MIKTTLYDKNNLLENLFEVYFEFLVHHVPSTNMETTNIYTEASHHGMWDVSCRSSLYAVYGLTQHWHMCVCAVFSSAVICENKLVIKTSILWYILLQALKKQNCGLTIKSLSPTCSRPSFSAAPPSMILVTYMLLSPGMCWFPTPPAILKPSPVCVCVFAYMKAVG